MMLNLLPRSIRSRTSAEVSPVSSPDTPDAHLGEAGERRFLTYYLVCVVGAAICQLVVGWWAVSQGTPAYPTIGASGGVFGLLLAYGMLFPNQRVMLLFPPIPMKARTFVIVFGVMELVLGFTGWQPGVAHFAHLGGMLFGWLVIRYWRGQPPFGRPKPPLRRS